MAHANTQQSFSAEVRAGRPFTYRRKIFEVLNQRSEPLSDRDVINILQASDMNNVRPEITRLIQDGILQECGEKKCDITHRTVRVIRIAHGAAYFDKRSHKSTLPPPAAPVQLGLFK